MNVIICANVIIYVDVIIYLNVSCAVNDAKYSHTKGSFAPYAGIKHCTDNTANRFEVS